MSVGGSGGLSSAHWTSHVGHALCGGGHGRQFRRTGHTGQPRCVHACVCASGREPVPRKVPQRKTFVCLWNLSELCPTESTPTDVYLSLSTPFIHASVRLSCIMSQRHLNTWFATALPIPYHFALKSSVLRAEFCRICGAFHYQMALRGRASDTHIFNTWIALPASLPFHTLPFLP